MRLALDLSESFKIAIGAIAANKGRGALTALGIIIGIVAVITTMTAANGLQNTFKQTFASVGSDVIYVSQRPWVQMGPDFAMRNRPQISLAVSDALTHKLRGRAIVNPSISGQQNTKYGTKQLDDINVIGTTDKQVQVSSRVPKTGRFLMPFDVQYKRRVAVIGFDVADGLFGKSNPLGKQFKIGRYDFTVIGVMNIMLVSVTERTKEIGIRKAIGAKRRSILLQFLFESSLICLAGGILGLLISAGITAIINAKLMPASLSPFIVVVALVVSVLVGVISGMIPAWRGARLDPIEALRYE
jgi:ABC-type antimicrobial peptide transport system permease subunit